MNIQSNISTSWIRIKSQNFTLNCAINYFIVALAFFIPISKAGTSFVEIMLILLWFIDGNFRSKLNEVRNNKFILTLLSFVLFSLLSVLWSNNTSFALNYIFKYWHFFIIIIIFTSLDKKYLEYIFSAFLASMFISEITSYGIFFEFWSYKNILPSDPSPFMDHTSYSSYLAFTILILAYRILYTLDIRWKIIYGFYFFSSMTNLFVNGGRTGQVIFLLSIVIFLFINSKNKIKAVLYGLMVGLFVFLFSYMFSPTFKDRMDYTKFDIERAFTSGDYTGAFTSRVALWQIGTISALDNPIIGTGIGDEAFATKKDLENIGLGSFVTTKDNYCRVDYHNNFVQYFVQLGAIGLFIILLLYYYLWKLNIKETPYKELKVLFIVIYFLWSMVGPTFHLNNSMVFFVLFASIFNTLNSSNIKIQ